MGDYMRAMLEELMGPNRNLDQGKTKHFDDPDVCKYFVYDFCPHDLFLNTRADLGPCPNLHDDRMRREYQHCPDKDRYRYKEMLHDYVAQLLRDLERKIRKGHSRLNVRGDENLERASQAQRDERVERAVELEERIKRLQEDMERLGEEGMIDEAREVSTQIDTLTAQLASVRSYEEREKRTIVCEVCGSLLASNDAAERMEAHLLGKQHTGYQKLRDFNNVPAPVGLMPLIMEKVRRESGQLPPDAGLEQFEGSGSHTGGAVERRREASPRFREDSRRRSSDSRHRSPPRDPARGDRGDDYRDRRDADRYGGSYGRRRDRRPSRSRSPSSLYRRR